MQNDKKAHRKIRHQLQRAIYRKGLSARFRAVATTRQMKAAARKIADAIFAGKNPARVQTVDGREISLQLLFA